MKNQNGITIMVLVVTIVIMLIISSALIYNVRNSTNIQDYNNMCADIELLENKISVYYNKYGEIPITVDVLEDISVLESQKNPDDGEDYYNIDLSKLGNISLNLGQGTIDEDKYIINAKTHTIYYLKGVDFEGEIYYCKIK